MAKDTLELREKGRYQKSHDQKKSADSNEYGKKTKSEDT